MLSVWLGGERSVLLYEWHDIIEKKGGMWSVCTNRFIVCGEAGGDLQGVMKG